MECPCGVPTIPKVLHKSVEWFGRSGVGFRGVDPLALFIPERPSLTGLTGATHRFDRCKVLWVLPWVNVLVSFMLSRVAIVSILGHFGARKVDLDYWGFLTSTGLTGVLHRPDRCRSLLWKLSGTSGESSRDRPDWCCSPVWPVQVSVLELLVPLCSWVCEGGCWFLGPIALPWLRGLGQLGQLSRRRDLEVVFVLLEFSSPSGKIFYRSHSLPPLRFA
jgi:hypothetical protein